MDTMNTKTLGCTLLIAGTTIGAGMLALPLASSSLGGPATLMLMVGLWALMAFTAMLQVEASLNTGKWYLHQLADHLLGPWGKRIASFCILMLFYSLASAYISGGSSLLARYAVPEVAALTGKPVQLLTGGTLAWIAAGLPLAHGDSGLAVERRDRYRRPYEGTDNSAEAMQAYLEWEYGLVDQLARDGTHGFRVI